VVFLDGGKAWLQFVCRTQAKDFTNMRYGGHGHTKKLYVLRV